MIKQTKIAMSMCSHLYKQKNKLVKNNLKFFLSKLFLNYKNILIKIRMHFSTMLMVCVLCRQLLYSRTVPACLVTMAFANNLCHLWNAGVFHGRRKSNTWKGGPAVGKGLWSDCNIVMNFISHMLIYQSSKGTLWATFMCPGHAALVLLPVEAIFIDEARVIFSQLVMNHALSSGVRTQLWVSHILTNCITDTSVKLLRDI